MALYLVGETIDARSAHRRAQAQEIAQLIRGVYVAHHDGDDEPLRYAVRIAHYLYPQAYLASASALTLGPTSDGRLFLSGRRNQRTRLRALEIVQNAAPARPSTVTAVVRDELGELRVEVASPLQRFLEAFRLRSEHASAIGPELRKQMAERLLEEYGSSRAAADALWTLARENQWYREGEGAERYLLQQSAFVPVPSSTQLHYIAAWHAEPLGTLSHDGVDWHWHGKHERVPALVRDTKPGRLPPFIESLLPEGWLEQVLSERDDRETLRNGRRYMSNVTIVPRGQSYNLPVDVLLTPLSRFVASGLFTGRYAGPTRGELSDSFAQNLARLFVRPETPRLSGVQIKAPMSLLADGSLLPAVEHPFTHILKPAGSGGFEHLPIIEWLCLELGRAAGFDVPAAALIDMPDGMPPALLVERFDIRRGEHDTRLLALEDFCSLLDLPSAAKYDGTIERCGKCLRAVSTSAASDLEILLRRALFAWLVGDGDMHLKNLALLRIAEPNSNTFTSVRFAPLYDAVSARVFPRLVGDRMALKLNGRDDRLSVDDFVAAGKTMGITATAARAACRELAERLRASTLKLPACAGAAQPMLDALLGIVDKRSSALASAL